MKPEYIEREIPASLLKKVGTAPRCHACTTFCAPVNVRAPRMPGGWKVVGYRCPNCGATFKLEEVF